MEVKHCSLHHFYVSVKKRVFTHIYLYTNKLIVYVFFPPYHSRDESLPPSGENGTLSFTKLLVPLEPCD